ncbi:hypothetical protein HY415_02465 [Candidatus Kaiserbacteria bacterium]|nr:hypothetical protein [Candidatus Kaiserbacteria bacterium]
MNGIGVDLCPHCDPYPNKPNHIPERLKRVFLSPIFAFIDLLENSAARFPRFRKALNNFIGDSIFGTLLTLGILREAEADDFDDGLYNRSLVVAREARRRGIKVKAIKFFGVKGTNNFSIEWAGTKSFFEGLPHLTIGYTSAVDFDDKGVFKKLLIENNLPHARGGTFKDYESALRYVRMSIGFPVVVKPRSGSLSKHTSCNVRNEDELREAIAIVKIISTEFIVEEFITGGVHRITLVGNKVAASCLRESPNVMGDGVHCIKELVELKNKDSRRGPLHKRNFTLHEIPMSNRTIFVLASQNLTLASIPANGKKMYLYDKVILGCGADIHDTTDMTHPDTASLFKKVGALCAAPVIGIDFISPDISRSYREQKCAMLEANSLPYIDMHHYPVTGQARNVAGAVLDHWIASQSIDTV